MESKKEKKKKTTHRNREKCLPGVGGEGNRERLVKRYKLPFIRRIKSEDLMYNTVTILDNTVLYNLNFLRK